MTSRSKSVAKLPKIQQALWRYYDIYREVALERHAEAFEELSEREQLIARYCYEYMEGLPESMFDTVEWVAATFKETLQIEEPEDLYRYAKHVLVGRHARLLPERDEEGAYYCDLYHSWTDAHTARVDEMDRKILLMVPEENN